MKKLSLLSHFFSTTLLLFATNALAHGGHPEAPLPMEETSEQTSSAPPANPSAGTNDRQVRSIEQTGRAITRPQNAGNGRPVETERNRYRRGN